MDDRLPRITPEPLPPEREALFRLLTNLSDALEQVHGLEHRRKPRGGKPDDEKRPKDKGPEL
jgi:hypothetical protein